MLAGSLAERRLLSLVPESPVIVWRGSLAGNPGLVPASPPFRFDLRVEAPGERRCRVDRSRGGVMETIVERPAALDVHKASVTACARARRRRRSRRARGAVSDHRAGAAYARR